MADVFMPRLSESMEEGTILRWLKQDGDAIAKGEAIVEIETGIATMTYEADDEGTLEIVAGGGETLAVDAVIARIGPPPVVAPAPEPTSPPPALAAVTQSGTAKGDVLPVELTRTQGTLARRMAESKATVPDYSILMRCDMQAAIARRASLAGASDPAPTINDLVVRACGLALRAFPKVNGAYRDGRFELYSRVNVGVAVATEDAIIVPTVFDADTKSLAAIAADTKDLAARVRAGTITPPDLAGGTFTVSNLGMHGVDEFTAIINPPQAALLTVGAIADTPVAVDGEVVVRPVLALSLVCDHRIVTGTDAAKFLGRVRSLLEDPSQL